MIDPTERDEQNCSPSQIANGEQFHGALYGGPSNGSTICKLDQGVVESGNRREPRSGSVSLPAADFERDVRRLIDEDRNT